MTASTFLVDGGISGAYIDAGGGGRLGADDGDDLARVSASRGS